MGFGLREQSLSLQVDTTTLIESFEVPSYLEPLVGPALTALAEDLASKLQSNVSIWNCLVSLIDYVLVNKDMNAAVGFVMLGGFAVFLPVLNIVLLTITGYWMLAVEASERFAFRRSKAAINTIKHLSMLDVYIM